MTSDAPRPASGDAQCQETGSLNLATPRQTRREKVEDRERAIVAAARDVFIEDGFEGARLAKIAERCGIAEGTIYLYFHTKAALMERVLATYWDGLTEGATRAVGQVSDPGAQLRRLAEYHLERLQRDVAFLDLAARLRSMQAPDPALRRHMRSYVAVFDAVFQRCQDRGLSCHDGPGWVARDMFFGTLEYAARTMLQGQDRAPDVVVDHLIAAMLKQPQA